MINKIKSFFFGGKQTTTKNNSEINVGVLKEHPLLSELREWSLYRSKVLDITNPIKKNMAEFYLSLLFSKINEMVEKAIDENGTYLSNTAALNNLIVDTINAVTQTAIANGVPSIFLDKFTNYLYKQAKILANTYKDLDNFEYYENTMERATFRLDIGFMLIRCITSEIESVINDMNGELQAALEGSIFDK